MRSSSFFEQNIAGTMDQALTTGMGCLWDVLAAGPRVVSRTQRQPTSFAVIVRESRRSSIPEAPVLEPRSRGVLDRPVKPGDDSGELSKTIEAGA